MHLDEEVLGTIFLSRILRLLRASSTLCLRMSALSSHCTKSGIYLPWKCMPASGTSFARRASSGHVLRSHRLSAAEDILIS